MPKVFHFSLKRVQQYKEQILESEKAALATLNQEKNRHIQKKEELAQFLVQKEAALQERSRSVGMSLVDLNGFKYYRENTTRRIEEIERALVLLEQRINAQRQVVIQASQELSGLNKLEEKQLEEYNKETAKEFEQQINEGLVHQLAAE